MADYTPQTASRNNENTARYRADPEKRLRYLARAKAKDAINRGDLVRQPCEKCGEPDAHAHHDDYAKPCDVRWLCQAHHAEHHQQEKQRPFCPSGHAMEGNNVVIRRGWRECRMCRRKQGSRRRAS